MLFSWISVRCKLCYPWYSYWLWYLRYIINCLKHLSFFNEFRVDIDAILATHAHTHMHFFSYEFLNKKLLILLVVLSCRLSFAMKAHSKNDDDLESGKLEKDRERSLRSSRIITVQNKALLSGLAYCMSSCSMILINKYVLSSYDFNAGISLMLYQVQSNLLNAVSFI